MNPATTREGGHPLTRQKKKTAGPQLKTIASRGERGHDGRPATKWTKERGGQNRVNRPERPSPSIITRAGNIAQEEKRQP